MLCKLTQEVDDRHRCGEALVFDLEDAVAAAKEGYPRILALVEDTLEALLMNFLVCFTT